MFHSKTHRYIQASGQAVSDAGHVAQAVAPPGRTRLSDSLPMSKLHHIPYTYTEWQAVRYMQGLSPPPGRQEISGAGTVGDRMHWLAHARW